MMLRFACRSLAMSPVKTVVLASGFGLGVAIMAILLGIGEVILEQAHSPALQGGGDVTVAGAFGSVDSARFVLSSVLGAGEMRPRVAAASPSKRSTLYLIAPDKVWAISARGGVPSLETAVGDAETEGRTDWVDAESDQAWTAPDPGDGPGGWPSPRPPCGGWWGPGRRARSSVGGRATPASAALPRRT